MRNRKLWWIAAVCVWALWWTFSATAQDGAKPAVSATTSLVQSTPAATTDASAPEAESPKSKIEEVRPSIFYLPDKKGGLQAVLDFKYEDFVELYKVKQRLERRDERPRYSLQRMSITGTAAGENAELTVQFQIALRDEGQWTRVPLRLDQALLRKPVEYKGSGDQIIHFEGEGQGYAAWIRGKTEGSHDITLKMLVPLSRVGEGSKIKLFMPLAAASEMKLQVPEINAEAEASEGVTLLSPAAGAVGGTVFTALGLGGEFQLIWHKAGAGSTEASAVLEATGNILARLDSQGVSSEAALSVRSYSSAFDRFVVRLPPEAELTRINTQGYSVLPLKGKNSEEDLQSRIEVRLQKKTTGPVEIRMSTRRDFGGDQSADGFDLAGFEVVGAARQWGAVAVKNMSDRQIVWGPLRGVRQVDQLPESLRGESVLAGFEYSAVPFMLNARLAPRQTRINVDPEYVLLVDQDRVRIEVKLSCFIRGAKINVLRMAMPDWEIDEVGPENLVSQDGIDTDSKGSVSIPLKQPASGKLELNLRAHKMLPKSADAISVSLPVPEVRSPSPAMVAVVPSDNVELTPDANSIQGLIRQQIASAIKLPDRNQDALFYRSEGSSAVFAAKMSIHSGQVTADAASRVHIEEGSAKVDQDFNYSIAYEPVDRLLLDVPRSLAGSNRLEIQRDGKPLSAKIITETEAAAVTAGIARMSVSLPEATIGPCALSVRYTANEQPPDDASGTSLSVPLVMPTAELTGNKLYLTAEPGIKIVGHGDAWKAIEGGPSYAGRQTEMAFNSDGRQNSFNLEMQCEDRRTISTTAIERAWIQTWLSSSARQDRAVFQFTANQKELLVRIPTGAAAEQTVVMLDGKRVEAQKAGDNRLLLPLADDGQLHDYLLDLRYHFPGPRPVLGLLSFDFPRIGENVWARRTYWQLVLPQNEHVLINPPGFDGEYYWKWFGYYWGREPLLSQTQLENWIGVSQSAVSPEGGSVYLYGILGNADHAELRTVGRTWIVLIASGAALILGLMLIYATIIRHPLSLLVLSLTLLGLAMIYPEPAAMIAQASGLGLALTIMAGLLERSMAYRRKKVVLKEPSTFKIIRDFSSSRIPQPPSVSSGSSTQALPNASQSIPQDPAP